MQFPHSSFHHQPVQALPSSPFSQPHLLSSPSHAPPAVTASHHHAVPFGAIPGSQPGVLGWGVGMSAANGAGFGFSHSALARQPAAHRPSSVGWGSAAAAAASGSAQQRPASPSPSAQNTPANPRRRRRSASPGMSSDDDDQSRAAPSLRAIRPMQSASAKRARKGPAQGEPAPSPASGAAVVGDLGKALGPSLSLAPLLLRSSSR